MSQYDLQQDYTGFRPLSGFYSTPSEAWYQGLHQQQTMANQQFAYMMAGRPLADLAARMTFGESLQQLQQRDNNMAAAMRLGGGLVQAATNMGGDAGVMMQGIQQSLGGGHFRVRGMNDQFSSYLAGQNGLSGTFARDMYSSMENHFFSGGAAQRHRTHGLDRTDMGVLMNSLQQRGAFTGMNIGSVEMMTEQRLSQLSNQAVATGNTALQQEIAQLRPGDMRKISDPNTTAKINEMMEDGAATLAAMRDIFGHQSMDVLIKEAERITGMTFSGGNMNAMRNRMETARTQARVFGLNERAFMEFDFATSGTTAASLAGRTGTDTADTYRLGAAATPFITAGAFTQHRQQQEAANRLAQEGRHLQVRSAQDIAAQTAEGAAAFMAYDTGALVASNVIDNFGDETGRFRHMQLMDELSKARTPEEAARIKQAMKDNAQQYYTGDIEQLRAFGATAEGRAQMMRTMSDDMNRALGKTAVLQETRARQGVQVSFQRDMAGITALSEDEMHDFQSKFDLNTRMDIAAALQSGDWSDVDLSILGDASAQEAYKKKLQGANSRSGGKLGRQLDTYNTYAAADTTLSNTYSEMDERSYYRDVLSQSIADNAFGGQRGQLGIADLLMQGLAGNAQVTDEMILRQAQASGKYGDSMVNVGVSDAGAGIVSAADKAKMKKMLKGAGIDPSLIDGMGSAEGMGRLTEALKGSNLMWSTRWNDDGTFGGFTLGSSGMKKKVTNELETRRKNISGAQLLGMSEAKYVEWEKGQNLDPKTGGSLLAAQWDKLTAREADGTRRLDDMMSTIAADPWSDDAMSFKAFIRNNADQIMPALKAEEQRLRKEAGDNTDPEAQKKRAEADRIKEVRSQMAREGGASFLGYLITDRGETMALHSGDGDGAGKLGDRR